MDQCRLTVMEQTDDILTDDYGFNPFDRPVGLRDWVNKRVNRQFPGGWTKQEPINGINISSLQEDDGIPIRTYRAKFHVAESAENMLDFVLTGRRYWDLDLIEWRKIADVDSQSDIIHYVSQSMSPHPHRDYCLFRSWSKTPTGKCYIYITSTKHEKVNYSKLISKRIFTKTIFGIKFFDIQPSKMKLTSLKV